MMSNEKFLNLTIYPHRSLSKSGFKLLMAVVILLCLTGGIIFWLLGAWPVFGFFGLDILLIYLAFKINYRSGKVYENLSIVSRKLRIYRKFPSGKLQVWELNPYWAKVVLIKKNNDSQVLIKSEDKVVSVGSFLNNFAKQNLKKKLSKSINDYKTAINV